MNVTLGAAPVSWGVWFASDPKQPPWQRFLDEVVEAGYRWIELGPYGYLPADLPTLRAELAGRGLKVSAGMAQVNLEEPRFWPTLEKEVVGAGELLAGLGAEFLILIDACYTDPFTGKLIEPAVLDDSAWGRLVDTTHRVADLAREKFGLRLIFHPDADSHVEYEHQIEALLEQTDPERVSLCLDTGHHIYRGTDPVSFLRRHQDRIPYLHLKNVDAELQKRVEVERISFPTAVKMNVFCHPAKGMVDFLTFRDVLCEIDYSGFAIVEQDMYPAPFDKPLPIARQTLAYFKEIGIG